MPVEQCALERLDYIFWLDKDTTKDSKLKVDVSKTLVEPHFVPNGYELKFSQFSDHYGVSTELIIE